MGVAFLILFLLMLGNFKEDFSLGLSSTTVAGVWGFTFLNGLNASFGLWGTEDILFFSFTSFRLLKATDLLSLGSFSLG